MGYTHYYTVIGWDTAEWQEVWPKLIEDVSFILEAADVLICGPGNKDYDLTPPIADVDEGIWFNGVAEDAHETFQLSRQAQDHFVKTLKKPYDIAVACVLLRAYLLAPNNFELLSDGSWDEIEWKKARQLYQELWPGDPIWCPWSEIDGIEESSHDKADGEASPKAEIKDDVPTTVDAPNAQTETSEILERVQSGLSSVQLESINSTVSGVDFTDIRQWLSRCEEDASHNECKASEIRWQNLPGVRFKVIDVHRRCIINAPDDCSFIVLTYVWGGVNQPMLTNNTKSLMMQEGGLDAMWPTIPLTIRDAITVCERLEERYLWVDALCIMQDSVRDKKLQILRMRQIYSAAKCTIVAVSADTAEVGLLGSAPNGVRACESVDSLDRLVESSTWSSRAWCYQEKVLSHRAILFTSSGIYMQCQNGTYNAKGTPLTNREDSRSVAKYNAIGAMLSIPNGEDLQSFISAVEYFSQRKLTRQEDKMNAFQGVFQRYKGLLDGKSSSFYYGLPISAFDQTFCWRTRLHNPHLRNQAFPSWSWLGWDDAVSFDRKMIQSGVTSQMIHNADYWPRDDHTDDREVRKPVETDLMHRNQFGFPAAALGMFFYNEPTKWVCGSVGDLSIAPDPVQYDGSNGLFAVFYTKCSQQPPPPEPRTISLYEWFNQPPPKLKFMDKETAAAASVPATKQSEELHDLNEHDNHDNCEAKRPVGYIWLDRKWREKQPKQCVMKFMALAGEKDVKREGQWVITMLMCLQKMEKNGHFWAYERVHIMDCEIREEEWIKARSKVIDLKFT